MQALAWCDAFVGDCMYTFSSLCGNILLDGTGDRFRLAQNELDDRRIKVGEWEFINI